MDAESKLKRPRHPRADANIFEVLSFSWILSLFSKGRKRDLCENDLYATLNDHKSFSLGNELEKKWLLELDNAPKSNRNPSLLRVLIQMFGCKYMLYGVSLFINENILRVTQPLFIDGLLEYFNKKSKNTSLKHAYISASCLVVCNLFSMILYHTTIMIIAHCGMKMRVACCSAVYRKSLRLSHTAISKTTTGHVINMMSNDLNRIENAPSFLHYLWIGPIQIVIITYFMWQEIGVSSIFGLVALTMFIPLQGLLGKIISKTRLKAALRTDERVRLMNEIILGIQMIKMYTWEKLFAYLVQCARKKEILKIKQSSFIKGILSSFVSFQTKIALFISILSYVLLGNMITAQKVFVIISYFNILLTTITIFIPLAIVQMVEILVSIKRIQHYLLHEEKDNQLPICSKTYTFDDGDCKMSGISDDHEYASNFNVGNINDAEQSNDLGVFVSEATAKWTSDQTAYSLENVNLTARPGRLAVVIGPVGAGKSTLLQAILRELPLCKGEISVRGIVSYASQEPWLFDGSVRQNILFGLPMDKKRYKKIIEVCALQIDFKNFPYGDKTIVGERGVFLSGGQRARIHLARAVYRQADIYLLDDPLSAVDPHVGKYLYEQCIRDFLKEKTCILVTHQLQYLTDVDQILLMENAKLLAEGSYQEIQGFDSDFTKLLGSFNEVIDDAHVNESDNKNAIIYGLEKLPTLLQDPIISDNTSTDENNICSDQAKSVEVCETRCSGNVSRDVYFSYISAGGNVYKIIFLLILCIFNQFLVSGGDYWIAFWVNLEEYSNKNSGFSGTNNSTPIKNISYPFLRWSIDRQNCITIFIIFTFLMVSTTLIKTVTTISVCMKASMKLHDKVFYALTRANMYFFNTNSSGQILNRFSNDMGAIDDMLPIVLLDIIRVGMSLIGIVIIISLVNGYLMIPTIIVGVIFWKLRIYYLSTSRSVIRLEGVTRSPVFAHFNTTYQGLKTIRAFGAERVLSKEFDDHQDLHSSASYLIISSSKAFGFWMDLICNIYICVLTFSFLVIDRNASGGNVGLAITQAISLIGMVHYGIKISGNLENQMTSVERVLDYTAIPKEPALESPSDKKPVTEWPQKGQITFKHFYFRYNLNTPHILKNLNFSIGSMEKIGIVGRTGSGKSSLIKALFRLAINEGHIFIDNLDISQLGLHDLRSKISIIPQEPVLFSGTIRNNLDPFDEYSDHILWNALSDVKLKNLVDSLPGGLNAKMSEGGLNLSVGQRQLACLARAIVKNNSILVLDEATANVDPQTDALIQVTIKNKFRNCTVLTIAHRLNTIMQSDKLLVIDAGELVEFDHPHILLKNENGFFYKMVEETGKDNAEFLRSVAIESFKTMLMATEFPIKLVDEDADDDL